VIKRLKNPDEVLTKDLKRKMKQIGERFSDKNYNIYFEWTDDKIPMDEIVISPASMFNSDKLITIKEK
jgi:hypothetical protein